MQTQQTLDTTAQDDATRAADQSARQQGPQLLDPRDLERVAGGLPRGGWGGALDSSILLD